MLKKLLITPALIAALAFASDAATVTFVNGVLDIKPENGDADMVSYRFEKCMANKLFTFSRVYVNGRVVNSAQYSDNIGPFLITSHGWTGGNHKENNKETAQTLSYTIELDGVPLEGNINNQPAERVDINVTNELYDPAAQPALFATEEVHYIVMGNSIQVEIHHTYHNKTAFNVDRYYGMQSMMEGETELLTPQGAYATWTPIQQVSSFKKQDYPDFSLFVEHSPYCYQASYMSREGLGDRHLVKPNDVVFIGNSSSKCYHKLIGGASLKDGDESYWKGVYTWFVKPMVDTTASGGDFVYNGFYEGKPAIFHASASEPVEVTVNGGVDNVIADNGTPVATSADGAIIVPAANADAVIYSSAGVRVASGAGTHHVSPGIYIVSDAHGNTVKLAVK